MGAKTALLVYTEQHPADLLRQEPELDRDATSALVAATHPGWTGTARSTESLPDCVYLPDGVVYAGSFPGIVPVGPVEAMPLYPGGSAWVADLHPWQPQRVREQPATG